MSLEDDMEEKSSSYQARRPELQKIMLRAIRRGINTFEARMKSILRNMQYQGGFETKAQAQAWLNEPVSQYLVNMLMEDAEALEEPYRTQALDTINRKAYAYRYNREKVLKDALEIQEKRISAEIVKKATPVLTGVALEAYGRSMFGLQKQLRIGFTLSEIPETLVKQAVTSQLTFTRSLDFIRSVTTPMRVALIEGILTGKNSSDIARDVMNVSDKSQWVSKAFARTALTEVSNEAEKKTLEESGLKRYRYLATLDERTCPVCGGLDGKVFNLDDARKGVNFPPMHRNCRCVHTAVLSNELRDKYKRRARDAEGKSITVPQSMTYAEWKAKFMPSDK